MAEKRLIDADALFPYGAVPYITNDGFATAEKIKAIIDRAPTVDAVEVVRCNDCRYYNLDGEYCGFWGGVRHPEHYCGEGDWKSNG